MHIEKSTNYKGKPDNQSKTRQCDRYNGIYIYFIYKAIALSAAKSADVTKIVIACFCGSSWGNVGTLKHNITC